MKRLSIFLTLILVTMVFGVSFEGADVTKESPGFYLGVDDTLESPVLNDINYQVEFVKSHTNVADFDYFMPMFAVLRGVKRDIEAPVSWQYAANQKNLAEQSYIWASRHRITPFKSKTFYV